MKFTELGLNENLLKGITEAGYTECMPVQEASFAHTLSGRDACVQSQTGTGKTAAFLITIFQRLLAEEHLTNRKALIVAPTRELASQIEQEARLIGKHLDFTIGAFFGGVGYQQQEQLLKEGVDLIIGTPGRLLDFLQSRKMSFQSMGFLVIDEADRLFDMGFLPDLRRILRKMPPAAKRQTMLYSATLNFRARELSWEYMHDPVEIKIEPQKVTADNVTQEIYHVAKNEKMSLLLGILKREHPDNTLIFTNTKHVAVEVAARLSANGFTCQYIIGDLPQQKRLQIIGDVKSGKIPILVATNVASRGLHIDELDLVVNYDLPEDREDYVHRIGRTARAGNSGKAISLACDEYVFSLEAIESFMNMKIPVLWADEELFAEDLSQGRSLKSLIGHLPQRPLRGRGETRRPPRGGAPRRHATGSREEKSPDRSNRRSRGPRKHRGSSTPTP